MLGVRLGVKVDVGVKLIVCVGVLVGVRVGVLLGKGQFKLLVGVTVKLKDRLGVTVGVLL